MNAPTHVTIYSYQIGFGDCFLLAFTYPGKTRHVLIDFGTTAAPSKSALSTTELQMRIAQDITAKCSKGLDILVVSHRHADHLSGFETGKKEEASGDLIKRLNPRLIIQPWTEDPDLQEKAKGSVTAPAPAHAFMAMLDNIQAYSETIRQEAARMKVKRMNVGSRALKRLEFYGETSVKNLSAVKNLIAMGKEKNTKSEYVFYKKQLKTKKLLPGVKITVLGPPTIEQYAQVRKMRKSDEAEFWHLCAQAADFQANGGTQALFKDYISSKKPMNVRWLASRMQRLRGQELQAIVTLMDQAMNNTSVILLFEFNGKKLLFPGDAQIENWEYALKVAPDKEENLEMLRDVNLYKVGHHGSLNATPKTMWEQFANKTTDANAVDRLVTLLSTMTGKHGDPEKETEIPRSKLVEELQEQSSLIDTRSIKIRDLYEEVIL